MSTYRPIHFGAETGQLHTHPSNANPTRPLPTETRVHLLQSTWPHEAHRASPSPEHKPSTSPVAIQAPWLSIFFQRPPPNIVFQAHTLHQPGDWRRSSQLLCSGERVVHFSMASPSALENSCANLAPKIPSSHPTRNELEPSTALNQDRLIKMWTGAQLVPFGGIAAHGTCDHQLIQVERIKLVFSQRSNVQVEHLGGVLDMTAAGFYATAIG